MKLELLTSFTKNTPHEALFFGVMAARSQMFPASTAVVVLTFNSRLRAVKRSILLRTLRERTYHFRFRFAIVLTLFAKAITLTVFTEITLIKKLIT